MADTERNKQTVARLFDAFRAGDVDAFDELIAEDYVQHNPQAGNGLQAVKEFNVLGVLQKPFTWDKLKRLLPQFRLDAPR